MLDLQALEVFLEAAARSSFSEAGRRLNLSQPAVSQTVQGLEQSFGTPLFTRSGRGVRLTDAGAALVPMARELLGSARRLEETMILMQGTVRGHFMLGCSTSAGKYILPRLIAEFRTQYPEVRVDVSTGRRKDVVDRVLDGTYRFSIASQRMEHKDLVHARFYTDELILIVSADHQWAAFGRVHPDDLLDVPLILREEGTATYDLLVRALHQQGITPDMLNVVMILGNPEAMAFAVEEGLGVAFVSRLVAERFGNGSCLKEIIVEGFELKHDLYVMRSQRYAMTRSQSEFWDFLTQHSEPLWSQPCASC